LKKVDFDKKDVFGIYALKNKIVAYKYKMEQFALVTFVFMLGAKEF